MRQATHQLSSMRREHGCDAVGVTTTVKSESERLVASSTAQPVAGPRLAGESSQDGGLPSRADGRGGSDDRASPYPITIPAWESATAEPSNKRRRKDSERQEPDRKDADASRSCPHPCPHGRQKSRCKDCGGSSICSHGRVRRQCKECGGSAICPHGRRKRECKECGGSAMCPHGRLKRQCRDCGGASICAHGRRRSRCKECGGSAICTHGREKNRCDDCRAV